MDGPLEATLWKRYQGDLGAHPPQLLIVDNLAFNRYRKHFLDKFDFGRFSPMNGHYALMVAKGGELEKRLRRSGALLPVDSGP